MKNPIALAAASLLCAGLMSAGFALPAAADEASPPIETVEVAEAPAEAVVPVEDVAPEVEAAPAKEAEAEEVSAPEQASRGDHDDEDEEEPEHIVTIFCHKPGEDNQQRLETDDDGFLQGHLGHGDTLGECPTEEPEVTIVTPPTLGNIDLCGTVNDRIDQPLGGTLLGYIFVESNSSAGRFLQGSWTPLAGFAFPEGFNLLVDIRNTDVPCEEPVDPIVVTPEAVLHFVCNSPAENPDGSIPGAAPNDVLAGVEQEGVSFDAPTLQGDVWFIRYHLDEGYEDTRGDTTGVIGGFREDFTECPVDPVPPVDPPVDKPVTPVVAPAPVVPASVSTPDQLAHTGFDAMWLPWAALIAIAAGAALQWRRIRAGKQ